MQKLIEKRVTQAIAADLLQVSIRQVKRLLAKYRQAGASGLVSARRGKPSNRKLPNNLKELSIALIREHYHDFGILRTWMAEAGIWITRDQRRKKLINLDIVGHVLENSSKLMDQITIGSKVEDQSVPY